MVGTCGSASDRCLPAMPSARNEPDRTCASEPVSTSKATCACPPMRSATLGGPARYGTCVLLVPVIILTSSPATCEVEPVPNEPMLILPGLVLASAMNSATVCAGTDGFATITSGK